MALSDWPTIGNKKAIDFFESLLACERRTPGSIGGVYLVTGPTKVGRMPAVEHFISRLLGPDESHPATTIDMWPDVFRLRRKEDKREIGVDQAREFSTRLALSSFAGSYRVGIIHEAHLLSTEAANALLKTLEDAKDKALIFLVAEQADLLPATVVSRSQTIAFHPVPADTIYEWLISQHGLDRPFAKNISRLCDGRPSFALALANDKELLESYLAPARLLTSSFRKRLYERWKESAKLLAGTKGSVAAETAMGIVSSWRGVTRDMILTLLNQPELVRYAFLEEEIRQAARTLGLAEARQLEERLRQAAGYLNSNVSPLAVLENILITI